MQPATSTPRVPHQFLSRPLLCLLFASAAVLIAGLVATEFWVSHLHNNNEAAEKARQVSIALESLDELQRELAGKRADLPLLCYVNDLVRIRRLSISP